jgi:hypothetical protein
MDLNIGRFFHTAETDLASIIAKVDPNIQSQLNALFGQVKSNLTGVLAATAPTLSVDVTTLELGVEAGLTALVTSTLGAPAATLEAKIVNPAVQAAGDTAIAKIQAWVAANTK